MSDANNFRCTFHFPDLDLPDVETARKAILEAMNGPQFPTMISNLGVAAKHAATGPVPRGGSVDIKASCSEVNGKTSCEGSVTVKISF